MYSVVECAASDPEERERSGVAAARREKEGRVSQRAPRLHLSQMRALLETPDYSLFEDPKGRCRLQLSHLLTCQASKNNKAKLLLINLESKHNFGQEDRAISS